MKALKNDRPSKMNVWISACRPHTLPASISPILVGSSLAYAYVRDNSIQNVNVFHLSFCFGVFACLVQVGTNLHNDYSDFIKGADNDKRIGHARATQRGWLTPYQTAFGSSLSLVVAFFIGIYLTYYVRLSRDPGPNNFWKTMLSLDPYMLFVTFSSVFNAVAYTGGPYPLGYIGLGGLSIGYVGLGDLFVFLYFGIVAVITVPYLVLRLAGETASLTEMLFMKSLLSTSLFLSIPIGFLSTAIIVVNNLRDRDTDVEAGKRTLAVRFGEKFSRIEYGMLVAISYILAFPLASKFGLPLLWPLMSFPVAINQLKAVTFGAKDGMALNEHVGGTAKILLFYCILLALSLQMTRL